MFCAQIKYYLHNIMSGCMNYIYVMKTVLSLAKKKKNSSIIINMMWFFKLKQ